MDKHSRQAPRIVENIERADSMIQDLLDAKRIRAGQKLPLEVSFCDLISLAFQVTEQLSALYGDRFKVRGAQAVEGFWSCDALRRALKHLYQNAVKYGDPSQAITIQIQRVAENVLIEVHNLGDPIPEKEVPLIFQPFHQIKNNLVHPKKGWALGLTLVRGVAEAHGGSVSVRSDRAHGTTFKMVLPMVNQCSALGNDVGSLGCASLRIVERST